MQYFTKQKNNNLIIRSILALMFLVVIGFAYYSYSSAVFYKPNTIIRAAVDVGSGSTKLIIAKINLTSNNIEEILFNRSFYLPHQESLSKAKNNTFSEELINDGMKVFHKINSYNQQYGVKETLGVATASFRAAGNSATYLQRIYTETGLKIITIDHETESELAFFAASNAMHLSHNNYVVWDIGGGSLQMITKINNEFITHLCTQAASIKFKDHVLTAIKKLPLHKHTPNPLNAHEIKQGLLAAHNLAKKVPIKIREKLNDPSTVVISVGDLFWYNISDLAKNKQVSQAELREGIAKVTNKEDHEINSGNDVKFANVAITNAILVLGFMEELNIPEINIIHINTADGLFLDKKLWSKF